MNLLVWWFWKQPWAQTPTSRCGRSLLSVEHLFPGVSHGSHHGHQQGWLWRKHLGGREGCGPVAGDVSAVAQPDCDAEWWHPGDVWDSALPRMVPIGQKISRWRRMRGWAGALWSQWCCVCCARLCRFGVEGSDAHHDVLCRGVCIGTEAGSGPSFCTGLDGGALAMVQCPPDRGKASHPAPDAEFFSFCVGYEDVWALGETHFGYHDLQYDAYSVVVADLSMCRPAVILDSGPLQRGRLTSVWAELYAIQRAIEFASCRGVQLVIWSDCQAVVRQLSGAYTVCCLETRGQLNSQIQRPQRKYTRKPQIKPTRPHTTVPT